MTQVADEQGTSFLSSLLSHARSRSNTVSGQDSAEASSSRPSSETQQQDHDDDEDDEEDEGVQIENLLWSAQMELIAHRHASAIAKLRQAVALGSSAACATLGNLLVHGLHDHKPAASSPGLSSRGQTSSEPLIRRPSICRTDSCASSQTPVTQEDSLAAAELYILGLEIELGKPVKTKRKVEKMRAPHAKGTYAQRYGSRQDDGDASEDEEATEGTWFSLERALDLVVGITDSYRFGIVYPPDGDALAPSSLPSDLWERGAHWAREALAHSHIVAPPLPVSLSSSPRKGKSPLSRSSTTGAIVPGSSPRFDTALPTRSYAHPATTLPSCTPRDSPQGSVAGIHGLNAQAIKLRMTILVHLLYLLALHSWPTNRSQSRAYWQDIVTLANGTNSLGTKEGDEMVRRAQRRLDGASGSSGSEDINSAWSRAKKAKARHKNGQPESSAEASQPAPSQDQQSSAITIRPLLVSDVSTDNGTASLPKPGFRTPRPKFHFVQEDENAEEDHTNGCHDRSASYPSPPSTPPASRSAFLESTAILTDEPTSYLDPSSRQNDNNTIPPAHTSPPLTQKQPMPPPSARLLGRVKSSASIATLPSDFTFGRRHHLFGASARSSVAIASDSDSGAAPSHVRQRASSLSHQSTSWTRTWSSKLSRLRNLVLPSTSESSQPQRLPSATEILQDVLIRDELSAGPGMMWADAIRDPALESDVENDSDREQNGVNLAKSSQSAESKTSLSAIQPTLQPSQTTPQSETLKRSDVTRSPRHRLVSSRSQRSFFDPTTATPYSQRVPDPIATSVREQEGVDGSGHRSAAKRLLAASQRGSYSTPNLQQREMDPLLKELERRSRVGVRTVCATCGKKGLNFPTAKGGATFCSRECRVKSANNLAGRGARNDSGQCSTAAQGCES